ncbi:barstar family protein [Actinophytocola sp. NPDC049390]|uniref:barstar family protein n=1 Tax=Actinophytocola sp. NPDC049390 TaxID=3363894 RepID=UPI0037A710B2
MEWHYALTAGDVLWGHGTGLDGFFEGDEQVVLCGLALRGAVADQLERIGSRRAFRGAARLSLLDAAGVPVGRYALTGFSPVAARMTPGRPGLVDLTVRAGRVVEPGAAAVWELVRTGRLDRPGLWRAYGRRAWLSVALNRRVHGPAGPLDGRDLVDVDAVYCALGEAVNGPGGYYGWNLDAVADCLRGGFGAVPPFTLEWRDADVARARVPEFAAVVSVLREGGVDVHLR